MVFAVNTRVSRAEMAKVYMTDVEFLRDLAARSGDDYDVSRLRGIAYSLEKARDEAEAK